MRCSFFLTFRGDSAGGRMVVVAALAAILVLTSGCYTLLPSSGAGQTRFEPPRRVEPADVALPQGYTIEAVATGLTFPTGVTFDGEGVPHVVESGYSYGEVWTDARLLRVDPDGSTSVVASGGRSGPWTGVTFHMGNFYIAEGNVLAGGRILRVTPAGEVSVLVDGLPSLGDHHTNGPAIGPDGWLYFGQGTATNSGVVGPDNAKFGWLKRRPEFHDIPGADITLTGANFESVNPLAPGTRERAITGPFLPFGTRAEPGQVIKGRTKCSGAILRVRPEGGEAELVAWGFRNPFGLAFAPDGNLYVTDNGYDDRGSRPVWGNPDLLWHVQPGLWYGWPDFVGSEPVFTERFRAPGKSVPPRLLADHPNQPPTPRARFGVHASADGLDFSRAVDFGHVGEAFVAIFGDQAPSVGKVLHPVGPKIVRVDVATGVIEEFASNRGETNGPASKIGGGGLERPLAVRFDPTGRALYVVDFGVLLEHSTGSEPQPGTGVLWRIVRTTASPPP